MGLDAQMGPYMRQSKYWCLEIKQDAVHNPNVHIRLGELCEKYIIFNFNNHILCFMECFHRMRYSTLVNRIIIPISPTFKNPFLDYLQSSEDEEEMQVVQFHAKEHFKKGLYMYIKGYTLGPAEVTVNGAISKLVVMQRNGYIYNGQEYIEKGITDTLKVPFEYLVHYNKPPNTVPNPMDPKCTFSLNECGHGHGHGDFIQEMIVYGYSLSSASMDIIPNLPAQVISFIKNKKGYISFTPLEKDSDGIVIVGKITFGPYGLLLLDKTQSLIKITIKGHVTCVLGKNYFLDGPERKEIIDLSNNNIVKRICKGEDEKDDPIDY